jgi:replicative DNA helicase
MTNLHNNSPDNFSGLIKEVLPEFIDLIEKRRAGSPIMTGIPSGFDDLDVLTQGFHLSELIVAAGCPGIGKTSFALSLAFHAAMIKKIPAAYFSLRVSATALVERLIAAQTPLSIISLRTGILTPADFAALAESAELIHDAPLYIVDNPAMTLSEIINKAKHLYNERKFDILFIDDLMADDLENLQELAPVPVSASRKLKNLARELKIPVVALAQLPVSFSAKKSPPILHRWRYTESDADLILFLSKNPSVKIENTGEKPSSIIMDLEILKSRNGSTGTISLAFTPKYAKFENLPCSTIL